MGLACKWALVRMFDQSFSVDVSNLREDSFRVMKEMLYFT